MAMGRALCRAAFPQEMDGGKDRQHKKRADIRHRDITEVRKAEQARQAHGHGRGKNERHDARPHAGEKGLNAAVFHEVPQHGGDEQQEQERRQHDAERRDQRAPEAPCDEPTNVAIFTASGPGVDSETAIKLKNSDSVSQPLDRTVPRTRRSCRSRRRRTARRSLENSRTAGSRLPTASPQLPHAVDAEPGRAAEQNEIDGGERDGKQGAGQHGQQNDGEDHVIQRTVRQLPDHFPSGGCDEIDNADLNAAEGIADGGQRKKAVKRIGKSQK